jgi:hypothetical protein
LVSTHGADRAPVLDQERLLVVATKVERYPPDTTDPAQYETDEQRQGRFGWISAQRDINPYLFALLEIHYKKHPDDALASVLEAVSLRPDLAKGQLDQIVHELKELLKVPWDPRRWLYEDYLTWGVLILQHYPSQENEELALKILERSTPDYVAIVMRANAMKTLARIGSTKTSPSCVK